MASTITKTVPVKLNAEEREAASREYFATIRQRENNGEEKSKAVTKFAARDKELALEQERLRKMIETGEEDRPVKCREEKNYDRGIVEFVRVDSAEGERIVVGHRPMTTHEKQLSVPGSEDATPEKPSVVDKDGLIYEATAEQCDALRNALNSGENGLILALEGVGERFVVAIAGESVKGKKAPKPRKPRPEEAN